MTVVHNANTFRFPLTPDFVVPCGQAQLAARARPGATVVTVSGEIDATNGDCIGDYLSRYVSCGLPLVVDMTEVEFLGVQGLQALFALGADCAKLHLDWALAASHAVSRILRVGDHAGDLPAANSLNEALRRVKAPREHRLLPTG